MIYPIFFLTFAVSFLCTWVVTPIVRKWALRLGFVDWPDRNHPAILHQTPIARAGGISILVGFVVATLLFAQTDSYLWAILIGGLVNVILGTLDDHWSLPPILRLSIQFSTALLVTFTGISFYVSNPFYPGIWYFDQFQLDLNLNWLPDSKLIFPADLIMIFWIIFLMNAANWSKGVSQLPGVGTIAFLTISGVAWKFQAGNEYQLQTIILSLASAGATLAFVPFNFPPEKMFPGFGASTLIGFNLAVLSVLSGGKVATVLMVFALPIIDAILVGAKRILTGHNPLIHDREHLYHFLLDRGLSKRQIIYLYWVTAAILGLSAIFLSSIGKIIVILSLFTVISFLFVFLYFHRPQKIDKLN